MCLWGHLLQTLSFPVVTSEEGPGFVRRNLSLSQAHAAFSLPVTAWKTAWLSIIVSEKNEQADLRYTLRSSTVGFILILF